MSDPTQHGMIGPDRQIVFAALLQFSAVVLQILLTVLAADSKRRGQLRVESPHPLGNLFRRNQCKGRRMLALVVHQKDAVKDLPRLMSVQGGANLGQAG